MSKSTKIDDLPDSGQPNITLKTSEKPVQITETSLPVSVERGRNPAQQPVQLSSTDINKIVEGIQLASANNMTTLPSKDIPMNLNTITNDAQIQPNYIPQEKKGFVEEFDTEQALMYKQQMEQKHDVKRLDSLYDELQTPLLICVLFFIFQLPLMNKKLFLYIPALFIKEGSLSLGGYIFKTFLFGSIYYGVCKFMTRLSSI